MIKNQFTTCALAIAVVFVGCDAMDDAESDTLRQTDPGSTEVPPMSDAGVSPAEGDPSGDASVDAGPAEGDIRNPSGAFFVSVKPNGTGCPRGTTSTSISPDGKTFTTTFSAFEAKVDKNQSTAVKDCQLAIKFKNTFNLSYAVTEFFYQGYAVLYKGQTASQLSRAYFQGSPVQSAEARTELVGPFDDTYTFQDRIRTSDLVWSPCGVERDLNVRATLRLQNSSSKKTDGYINIGVIDANTDTKIQFKLDWRKCSI